MPQIAANGAGKFAQWSSHTLAGGVQGTHVEDIDALHLSDELQTLETGGLAEVGRNGTGLGTGGNEIFLRVDFCRFDGDILATSVRVMISAAVNPCVLVSVVR